MTFTYQRRYRGPIQAVLLDWAGTTMDFGCMAPAVVFVEVFKRKGVPITMDEARAPMGAHKRVHIQKITEQDSVRKRWQAQHGRLPTDDDVEAMFKDFVPLQLKCLSEYSALIPGTRGVIRTLRKRGYRIGSTTGYMTEMMKINLRDAAKQGYVPDSTVCASEVPAGRPYPYMCLQNMMNLGVSPVEACVKIDDTRPGRRGGPQRGHVDDRPRDQRQRDRPVAQGLEQAAEGRPGAHARGRLREDAPVRRALRRRRDHRYPAVPRRHRGEAGAGRAPVGHARQMDAARYGDGKAPRQPLVFSSCAAGPEAPLPARNASAIANAACVNFSTSAKSSSDRRRAASLAR